MTAVTRPKSGKAGGSPAARRAAAWLRLAAAPTFALMALATLLDASPAAMLCSGGMGASPLAGMAPMYLLMAAFHLGPWLEALAGRRGGR